MIVNPPTSACLEPESSMMTAGRTLPAGRLLAGLLLSMGLHAALLLVSLPGTQPGPVSVTALQVQLLKGDGAAAKPVPKTLPAAVTRTDPPVPVVAVPAPVPVKKPLPALAPRVNRVAVAHAPKAARPSTKSVPNDTPVSNNAPLQAVAAGSLAATADAGNVSTQTSKTARQALSMLLHARIHEHRDYPYMARRQGREGTASIGFLLHPDGGVSAVTLEQSSGHRLLDRAALRSVESIAPFAAAGAYLRDVENFKVDVDFRLKS